MIAEVISGFYDFDGKRIFRPTKRHGSFWVIPMGSFLTQPLQTVCHDLDEIRGFLSTCRYVSDHEQFGVQDHWAAPEHFEKTRRGDCDDFALWAWRQLVDLGYDAHFVVGRAGRYRGGHAWVTFRLHDKTFLLEPQLAWTGATFPRLETLRYIPSVSVVATRSGVRYFEHPSREHLPGFRTVVPLVPEWLLFRLRLIRLWLVAFCTSDRTRYSRKYVQPGRRPWIALLRRTARALTGRR